MSGYEIPEGFTVPVCNDGPQEEKLMVGGVWTIVDQLEFDQMAAKTLSDQDFLTEIWDLMTAMDEMDGSGNE